MALTCETFQKSSGKTSVKTRLFVASLPPASFTPKQWFGFLRGHWSVESANHYRRDVTWREDDELGRRPRRAANLALLRSALLGLLLRDHPDLNLRAFSQHCSRHPHAALRLILSRHPSVPTP